MQAEQRLTHRPTQPGYRAAQAEEGPTKWNTTPVPATGDIAIAIEEENPLQVDELEDYLDVFISAVVGSLLIAGVLFL
jgi:hypothetical protein